jgi:hypothetical protein|mmetsp:Transcript_11794/g.21474  ORF Transcript_11794/g.21474 Transcript_11794/m.21474 type:complete len:83 (-) Transcript_11794:139-387(-)
MFLHDSFSVKRLFFTVVWMTASVFVSDGTRMAEVDFYYNEESVYAASDTSLCMEYHRVSANVDVDPIIMKEWDEVRILLGSH